MNELRVFNFNDAEVVDSREVAEWLGIEHKNLLTSIRGYIFGITRAFMDENSQLKIKPSDFFIESTFENRGKQYPCYLLTKKGCDMVANKMTGEKGVRFTAAYVTAFEKMREKLSGPILPQDFPSALRALADAEEKRMLLAAENEKQRQVIADFEPIRQYVDTILESTGTMATTQIAADYGMSAKQLNRILNEAGIQRNVNGQWILYKKYMGKGYTESKTFNFTHADGRPDAKINTMWTQKGRLLIHSTLETRGIHAVMDREAVS